MVARLPKSGPLFTVNVKNYSSLYLLLVSWVLAGEVREERYQVEYLPPIHLHFTFPPTYPSQDPPCFTLSCKWLNRAQVSRQSCSIIKEIKNETKLKASTFTILVNIYTMEGHSWLHFKNMVINILFLKTVQGHLLDLNFEDNNVLFLLLNSYPNCAKSWIPCGRRMKAQ